MRNFLFIVSKVRVMIRSRASLGERGSQAGRQGSREGVAGVVNHEVIASICYNLHPGAL